jgi:serine/threonine protein kinase
LQIPDKRDFSSCSLTLIICVKFLDEVCANDAELHEEIEDFIEDPAFQIDEVFTDSANQTQKRLELFKTICSAVQHEHENLVIHWDLKPSNILITHDGELKLLDFGVAKVLNPELMGDNLETQFHISLVHSYSG